MVQQFITYSIEFIFWAFAAHTVFYFTAGFMARRNRKPSPGQLSLNFDAPEQPEPEQAIAIPDGVFCCDADPIDGELVEQFSQTIQQYWAIVATDNVVPFQRPVKRQAVAIDWATLSPAELRKTCQQRGIKWRNAHGLNCHLSKAEMVQALSQSVAA